MQIIDNQHQLLEKMVLRINTFEEETLDQFSEFRQNQNQFQKLKQKFIDFITLQE